MSINVVSFGNGLPVVVYDPSRASFDEVYSALRDGYKRYYGEEPSGEVKYSWRATLPMVLRACDGYPLIIEYPVLGGLERVDYIVVGRGKALIVEAKSWFGEYDRCGEYFVCSKALGEKRIDPCYQLENYIAKFKYLHSAGSKIDFKGVVFAYGFRYSDGCPIVRDENSLKNAVDGLGEPGGYGEVDLIVNGKFQISNTLIRFIKDNKAKLMQKAVNALLGSGYGLTESQMLIVERVLNALENGEDKAFIIHGVSGSGKTLIALTLFFEALSREHKVLLTYKNNRLLNTLRTALGAKLSGLIQFYSVGPRAGYKGVAEINFPVENYGALDLVIYDEAQRMEDSNIDLSLVRSRVKVYLYDEEQVLIGYESGYTDNFVSKARMKNISFETYELPRPARIPYDYLQAIRNLLNNGVFKPAFTNPDFRVYSDIRGMLMDLRKLHNEGRRVALVASFTETPGNRDNRRAPDNLRIGYPLCKKMAGGRCVEYSDLDIYRDSGLEIYWLMDEKEEYPSYWMGLMDPLAYCASVYGAQGFEAEYVGVIWGRDLVWRGDRWVVNPNVITDDTGGKHSLQKIALKDIGRALRLLINRYIILLTRGTKGVYVFFEDMETYKHVAEQINRKPS